MTGWSSAEGGLPPTTEVGLSGCTRTGVRPTRYVCGDNGKVAHSRVAMVAPLPGELAGGCWSDGALVQYGGAVPARVSLHDSAVAAAAAGSWAGGSDGLFRGVCASADR